MKNEDPGAQPGPPYIRTLIYLLNFSAIVYWVEIPLPAKIVMLCVIWIPTLLGFSAAKNPDGFLAHFFFGFIPGLRTDVPNMDRKQLFLSGARFLAVSLALLLIWSGMVYLFPMSFRDSQTFLAINFVVSFIFLMFFAAGLYLLVRGLFRRKNWKPTDKKP